MLPAPAANLIQPQRRKELRDFAVRLFKISDSRFQIEIED